MRTEDCVDWASVSEMLSEGATARDLAVLLRCSETEVEKRLKGAAPRPSGSRRKPCVRVDHDRVFRMHARMALTDGEIADELGCSRAAVAASLLGRRVRDRRSEV